MPRQSLAYSHGSQCIRFFQLFLVTTPTPPHPTPPPHTHTHTQTDRNGEIHGAAREWYGWGVASNWLCKDCCALQTNLTLFCGRFNITRNPDPAPPNVTFVSLSGSEPEWAVAVDGSPNPSQVYFEIDVIFADPVVRLLAQTLEIEAGMERYLFVGIVLILKGI